MPDWYLHLRAAKYLGVAPWDLLERPDGHYWITWANIAEGAESEASESVRKHNAMMH